MQIKLLSNKLLPKKADSKLLTIYWFMILLIVAAGIVYITSNFYGKPYDVREIEGNLLINHAADCFAKGGYVVENALSNLDLDDCKFNFNSLGSEEEYYLELQIFNFDDNSLIKKDFKGNTILLERCNLEDNKNQICSEKDLFTIDKMNNKYKLKIISAVLKTKQNAN